MNVEFKARIMAAVAAEPSPTRAAVARRNAVLKIVAAASGMSGFVIFALLMSDGQLVRLGGEVTPGHYVERSVWLVVMTAGGALGIAAMALWLALGRGRSMLGRSRRWLWCGSALIPIGLFAWKVGCSLTFGGAMVGFPERLGLRCLALSLLVAGGPLLAFLAVRRSAPVHPALNGAVMGVAAGSCAWVAVDLWCPVAFVPHLLLGHLLPLFILAGTGALLGHALLSVRGDLPPAGPSGGSVLPGDPRRDTRWPARGPVATRPRTNAPASAANAGSSSARRSVASPFCATASRTMPRS